MYLDNVVRHTFRPNPDVKRRFDGVDIFVEWNGTSQQLAQRLEARLDDRGPFKLTIVSNWGTMMYPSPSALEHAIDQWRCRFIYTANDSQIDDSIAALLNAISAEIAWVQVEKLMSFDGVPGYSRAQHQA